VGVVISFAFIVGSVAFSLSPVGCTRRASKKGHISVHWRKLEFAIQSIRISLGLYTILPFPILYAVWHTPGVSGGGACIAQKSCNSIAMVWALKVGYNAMLITCSQKL